MSAREIFNTRDEKVGEITETRSASGVITNNLVIEGGTLNGWDVISVIQQAVRACYNPAVAGHCVERIEFKGIDHIIELGLLPNAHFDALPPALGLLVKELKFTSAEDGITHYRLFKQFAEMVWKLSLYKNFQGENKLRSLDLSGCYLRQRDLYWLDNTRHEDHLGFNCLRLQNCGLTDADVTQLKQIVEDSGVTQLFLHGNNISDDSYKELAVLLNRNSQRIIGEHLNTSMQIDPYWKADDDFPEFDLAEVVELFPGKSFSIPARNGILDVSDLKIEYANDYYNYLRLKLAASNPRIILANNPTIPAHDIFKLFDRDLSYSESVRELVFINAFTGEFAYNYVADIASIAVNYFPKVEVITVKNGNFKGQGGYSWGEFDKLIAAPNLRILNLQSCSLRDGDIFRELTEEEKEYRTYITARKAGDKLREVDLSGNLLTDSCVEEFRQWLQDSNVIDVNLSGTNIRPSNILAINQVIDANAARLGERKRTQEEKEAAQNVYALKVKPEKQMIQNPPKPKISPNEFRRRLVQNSGVTVISREGR